MITFGSLFAGIGGIDLGLERAGMVCRWQVEIDAFCQQVLERHWPDVQKYRDIREVGDSLEKVDLICGGFPCQDVSLAGKRRGLDGNRSGLWSEMSRIIRILRPRYVLVENVPGLLSSGFGRVLGDLAESGYDAEWDCIPAAAFGAPHLRYRVFIVAYPHSRRLPQPRICSQQSRRTQIISPGETVTHPTGDLWRASGDEGPESFDGSREVVADAKDPYRGGANVQKDAGGWHQEIRGRRFLDRGPKYWSIEPDVGRVAYGVPNRVERLKSLGNAVVPQVAEWIGRRILYCDQLEKSDP